VVAQFVLFALVVAGPTTWHGWPAWAFPDSRLTSVAAGVLLTGGASLAIAGARKHGSGLRALPYPAEGATVLETGPYRVVRHPIYCGVACMAFGWALWLQGWLTCAYAALLFLLFDAKARLEERWLVEKFPSYADYQRRVRKLVPFVY
jgi:protein-S-isoprenylcysteine O-methyltransferase Ste14